MEKNPAIKDEIQFANAKKRVKAISDFYQHLIAYILVNAILLVLKYFVLEPGEPFFRYSPIGTAVIWGIGLAAHAVSTLGPHLFPGKEWEQRKIKGIMDKNAVKRWE